MPTMALAGIVDSKENPFVSRELHREYLLSQAEGDMASRRDQPGMGMMRMGPREGYCGGMMGGRMGMMHMMDTDRDGRVSKEEFIKHHEWMHRAMDANSDGQIDASEMGQMGPMGPMMHR